MMRRNIGITTIALLIGFASLTGCSSGPSEEEMKQLKELQDEIVSLQKQVEQKNSEKRLLQKQVADKQSQLAAELKEQEAAKQRMESQK